MKISFWSPSQGVGAVTSNLACISAMFSMVFRYKSIIIENHRQKNKINHFMESRINQNLVFEDNSYYYNYTGMDSVLYKLSLKEGRFLKSNLADVEKMIVNELNSVFDDYLFYISSDNKMNNIIFEQLLSQYIPTIIEASKRFANLTFIDTQSSNNLSTPYILQEADLIVVNISQDPVELDNLFKNYKSILSKCLFLISNYNEESYFNLNKISQMFEIDQSRIAAIPFNSDYKDALTRGSLVSYLIHNYDSRTNHENAKFVNAIIKATIMINNRLSFVVNKKKNKEDLCEGALKEVALSY